MKVYRFLDLRTSKQPKHQDSNVNHAYHRKIEKSAESEDIIEISEEARQKLEKDLHQQHDHEEQLKMAHEVYYIIQQFIDMSDGDMRNIYRPLRVMEINSEIQKGRYDFNNKKTLTGLLNKIAA